MTLFCAVSDDLRRKLPSQSSRSGGSVITLLAQQAAGLLGIAHLGTLKAVLAREIQAETRKSVEGKNFEVRYL